MDERTKAFFRMLLKKLLVDIKYVKEDEAIECLLKEYENEELIWKPK